MHYSEWTDVWRRYTIFSPVWPKCCFNKLHNKRGFLYKDTLQGQNYAHPWPVTPMCTCWKISLQIYSVIWEGFPLDSVTAGTCVHSGKKTNQNKPKNKHIFASQSVSRPYTVFMARYRSAFVYRAVAPFRHRTVNSAGVYQKKEN